MDTTNLSVSGCSVNPHVDTARFCHRGGMKPTLQKLFVIRLKEELEIRRISGAALAKLTKQIGMPLAQSSVSRILAGKQDPSLEMVESISEALGIPPWFLMMQSGEVEQKIIRAPSVVHSPTVTPFPAYPKIFQDRAPYSKKALAHKKKKA